MAIHGETWRLLEVACLLEKLDQAEVEVVKLLSVVWVGLLQPLQIVPVGAWEQPQKAEEGESSWEKKVSEGGRGR